MEGPPLGPGGEDITWPHQVAPRSRKASSTRKIKPQTSNLLSFVTLDLSSSLTTPRSSCAASLAREASFDLLLFVPLLVASIRCRNHVTF